MRSFVSIIFLFIFHYSVGQLQFLSDTLNYDDRIGGDLDSVDVANALSPTTFNGGRPIWGPNSGNAALLCHDRTMRVFDRRSDFKRLKFTGLPHIGFAYSIGAQSSQFLRAEYQQVFKQNTILNLEVIKDREEGYLRNGSYDNSQLNMGLQHYGKIYSAKLDAFYYASSVTHNGGVTTDSLIDDFGLIFTPVYKANAASNNKGALIDLNNYFDLSIDSTLQLGLITKHRYEIQNRVYTELDTLYGLYNNINIDSVSTRDQYNLPSLRNGLGLFGSVANTFYADISFDQRYWRYQNLGSNTDTLEYYLAGKVMFARNAFLITSDLDLNLVGAFQGILSQSLIELRKKKFQIGATLKYDGTAPYTMNRTQHANNYTYNLEKIDNNRVVNVSAKGRVNVVDSMLSIGASVDLYQLDKYYLFDGNEWRNDTLQGYSFLSTVLDISFSWKALNLRSKLIISEDPDGYLPKLQSYSRIYMKQKVFKAKKLELLLGAEPQWSASFRQRFYLPYADAMYWFGDEKETNSLFNLSAFFGFKLDEFRFYVRYENIGYFWNDRSMYVMNGYPLAAQRLRFGITWDFFN